MLRGRGDSAGHPPLRLGTASTGQNKERSPSRCQTGAQHTALCCSCRTFVPRFNLPWIQQGPLPTIPASREVGTRARPTQRGKQVPGSFRAWHQGKRLAAWPLVPCPPALEPESAPKPGWSSVGQAAGDAQSPLPRASWACLAGRTACSWSVKLEVDQKAASACIQLLKMMSLQLSP